MKFWPCSVRLKFQTEGEDEKDYVFCATFGGRGLGV